MTGASPTGAAPSGRIQTTTTASGSVRTLPAGVIPLAPFRDRRAALDLQWDRPIGALLTSTVATHVSRERDYQSLGLSGKLSLDVLHRLATLTAGGGINEDSVLPVGGTPVGLSQNGERLDTGSNPKRVRTALVGLSRILTRRWMVSVDGSRTIERGYLTEPYKVVSVVDATGLPVSEMTEKRPDERNRSDVLANSVYHLTRDVLYTSYRYYWDDWGIRSHTVDLRYRRELPDDRYIQPHVRFYTQTPARFFTNELIKNAPLPAFASADYRLGPLRTVTVGATYGFHITDYPGEFAVRGEYMVQWGDGHPGDAVGVQRGYDLSPPLNIGSLMITYSVQF
jgi:hypothetical protein